MSRHADRSSRSPVGSTLNPDRKQGQFEAFAESLLGEPLQHEIDTRDRTRKREDQIVSLYSDHKWSMQDVGVAFDLTRERIRQLLAKRNTVIRPQFPGTHKKFPG